MKDDTDTFQPLGAAAAGVVKSLEVNMLANSVSLAEPLPAQNAVAERMPTSPARASESDAVLAMIERAARDPAVDISRMEQLFAMRERMEAMQAKRDFAAAMSEMQPGLPTIDQRGNILIHKKGDERPGKDREVIQSTPYALWADINEAIRPVLATNGFALSFRTGQTPEGKITVTAILSHRGGHEIETTIILAHDSTGSKNSVQAVGSSISYGKRYTAGLLLNFTSRAPADADDDGRKAGQANSITEEQADHLRKIALEVRADMPRFLAFFKADDIESIPAASFQKAVTLLEAKRTKAQKEPTHADAY